MKEAIEKYNNIKSEFIRFVLSKNKAGAKESILIKEASLLFDKANLKPKYKKIICADCKKTIKNKDKKYNIYPKNDKLHKYIFVCYNCHIK